MLCKNHILCMKATYFEKFIKNSPRTMMTNDKCEIGHSNIYIEKIIATCQDFLTKKVNFQPK